jgi:tetratricopeptide (TPR) repeat protein
MAWLSSRIGNRQAGIKAARLALELLPAELTNDATDEELILHIVRSKVVLAEAEREKNHHLLAIANLDEINEWLSQLPNHSSDSPEVREVIARVNFSRASTLAGLNPLAALMSLTEARIEYERIAKQQPSEDNILRAANALAWEANVVNGLGQCENARAMLNRCKSYFQDLCTRPEPLPEARLGLSTIEHLFGLVEFNAKNYSIAEQYFQRAYVSRSSLAAANPGSNRFLCHQTSTAIALARLYGSFGPVESADRWILLAHELLIRTISTEYPNAHLWPRAIEIHAKAGAISLRAGRWIEATRAFTLAIDFASRMVTQYQVVNHITEPKMLTSKVSAISWHFLSGNVLTALICSPNFIINCFKPWIGYASDPEPNDNFRASPIQRAHQRSHQKLADPKLQQSH